MPTTPLTRNHRKDAPVLDDVPFLQVCLHSVSDLPSDDARATAAALLDALDKGADVPDLMRSQVALFADACDRLEVLRRSASYRKLTALSLRETRRNALIGQDRTLLLSTLAGLGISATEIRGPMLGHGFYPAPDLRHTHSLKLAVVERQAHAALVAALLAAGWRHSWFTPQASGYRTAMTSPAGVEVELYQRLVPHCAHIPEPDTLATVEFQVAMILCQSPFEPQRLTKRWLCDLAFIFAATNIDETKVASLINGLGLAGSCSRALQDYLRLVPGSDASRARGVAGNLLAQLDPGTNGPSRNSARADAALRAHIPAPRSRVRRALSAVKRAIVSAAPSGSAR